MRFFYLSVFVLSTLVAVSKSVQLISHLNGADRDRFQSLFDPSKTFEDATSMYHAVRGLSLLGSTLPVDLCGKAQSLYVASALDSVFYTSSTAALLKGCKIPAGAAQKLCEDTIQSSSKVVELYQAFFSLKNFKLQVDNAAIVKALQAALKKDDSLLSHGYALLVAAELPKADAQKFYLYVEDMVAQADTVDRTYMQFEGGLHTTAVVLESMYKLGEVVSTTPLEESQAIMFSNYLLSRKHIHRMKSASQLLASLSQLSGPSAKLQRPVSFSVVSSQVSSSSPSLSVGVYDLMGESVKGLTVTATSLKHTTSGAAAVSNVKLTSSGKDKSVYTLDLSKSKALSHGLYKLSVSASPSPANKVLIGLSNDQLQVHVLTKVNVHDVELVVADRDQATTGSTVKVQHPKKASKKIEADYTQKLSMTFGLKDATGVAMQVHQAFVRLIHQETKREIVFVAMPNDAGTAYKFELDLGSREKEFGSVSGAYELSLILGDSAVENSQEWTVADLSLTFLAQPGEERPSAYKSLPEIKHKFREPEKRPPTAVSNLFTVLCLAPLLLLAILWIALGANVSNLSSAGLYGIGFHAGLAAIFGLYYMYWVQLNMFQTIQYLCYLGLPTFFFGNRLLRGIAEKRKS